MRQVDRLEPARGVVPADVVEVGPREVDERKVEVDGEAGREPDRRHRQRTDLERLPRRGGEHEPDAAGSREHGGDVVAEPDARQEGGQREAAGRRPLRPAEECEEDAGEQRGVKGVDLRDQARAQKNWADASSPRAARRAQTPTPSRRRIRSASTIVSAPATADSRFIR